MLMHLSVIRSLRVLGRCWEPQWVAMPREYISQRGEEKSLNDPSLGSSVLARKLGDPGSSLVPATSRLWLEKP